MRLINYLLLAALLLGGCGSVFGQYFPKYTPEQIRDITSRAKQGDAEAQSSLGWMYKDGEGVPQDYQLAAKWWRRAAKQWYRRAAEQGHVGTQFYLGVMYEKGQVVPKDYQEAAKWFKLASEQGDAGAQYRLGNMYRNYDDVQDYQLAFKWLSKATEQGHAKSQWFLGKMYHYGEGVPKDHVLAYKWFNLSAAQGNKNAAGNRDFLAENMTTSQIQEAQKLTREFKPKKENP